MEIKTLYTLHRAEQTTHLTYWIPRYKENSWRTYPLCAVALGEDLIRATAYIVYTVAHALFSAIEWAASPLLNYVYPINIVNNKRHCTIPRRIEAFLGDWIFSPLSLYRHRETVNEECKAAVQRVFAEVLKKNQDILNPADSSPFNYHVTTVNSSTINAFSAPGGGVVVYTGLVDELTEAFKNTEYKKATVTLANGAIVEIDLENLTIDDVLAAVLGHEMTHAASRHGIAALIITLLIKLLAYIDPRVEKIASYFNTNRRYEYEADIAGLFMAKRAGYDIRGALFLQEVLHRPKDSLSKFLHRNLEFLYSHPCGENRKKALFSAMCDLNPNFRYTQQKAGTAYHPTWSSPAIRQAQALYGKGIPAVI